MARNLWRGLWRDVVLNTLIASPFVPVVVRWRLLRAYGMDVTAPARISPFVWFGSSRVSIGAGTFVGYRCFFNTGPGIEIGKNCDIAMHVLFAADSHVVGDPGRRAGAPVSGRIRVEDGVWIGARAVILGGVTVGSGSIVAAGAVVTRDCAPDGVYAGVPARRIRDLSPERPPAG